MSVQKLFGTALQAHRTYIFSIQARGFKKHVSRTLMELNKRKENIEFGKTPNPPPPRSSYLEWNYDAELYSFGKRLGEHIEPSLLAQSLTQRSFIIVEEEKQKSVGIEDPILNVKENTPLVEEGKAFTSRYVKQYMRIALPFFPEEGIQSVHNYLLSEEVIANIASHIGMNDIVQTAEYPIEASSLHSCFFALVEAIRLSNDEHTAGNFVRDLVLTQLGGKNVNDLWELENPEDKLNTIYRNHGEELPEPRLVGASAKNTILANYQVAYYNKDKQMIGLGFGESVEIGKEMAARDALRRLFRTSERDAPIKYNLEINTAQQKRVNPSLDEWNEKILLQATG
uniref:Large ribosomal subunit protein mL44 n=1 Tax=Cacopsylla melanoneura TaxID=428564 RepID=A0A8D8RC96_9HEMI